MLQLLTRVKVVDNSGVILGRIIKILTPKNAKLGRMGSLIIISSKVQTKNSGILPGTKLKALIIRTKYGNKEFTHKIKWNNNSVVLVKAAPKYLEYIPVATRIKAPISSSLLRLNGYQKVISLCKHVI